MPKEEKMRTFESEIMALPPLKMVLVDAEKADIRKSAKKPQPQVTRDFNEDTVQRIIEKLSKKE